MRDSKLRMRLRTLFLIPLALGVILIVTTHKARVQKRAVRWILQNGGKVRYNWQPQPHDIRRLDTGNRPPGPAFVRAVLGDDFFSKCYLVDLSHSKVNSLTPLRGLRDLQELRLEYSQLRDLSSLENLTTIHTLSLAYLSVTDIKPLKNLRRLRVLDLTGTQVHDLAPLRDLENLEELHLGHTPVVDLSPLKKLRQLRTLTLMGSAVSDVNALSVLPLEVLLLSNTKITANQIEQLRKKIPNCVIGHEK